LTNRILSLLGSFLLLKSQTSSRLRTIDRIAIWLAWALVAKSNGTWRETARVQTNALELKSDSCLGENSYPKIELLTVATIKDLNVFPLSILSAIKSSLNPITAVTVIVPQLEIADFKSALKMLDLDVQTKVIGEDDFLEPSDRELIRSTFPNRYGWVLQQFLAVAFVVSSELPGVLLVNCDTVLTKRVHWLNSAGNQKLLASLEFHAPYYQVLEKVFGFSKSPEFTFVTHHMLFQPDLFRSILGLEKGESVSVYLGRMIESADSGENSPLCAEFEPYGQGLLRFYPHRVTLEKFANLGLKRTSEHLELSRKAMDFDPEFEYKSISLHSYLN